MFIDNSELCGIRTGFSLVKGFDFDFVDAFIEVKEYFSIVAFEGDVDYCDFVVKPYANAVAVREFVITAGDSDDSCTDYELA